MSEWARWVWKDTGPGKWHVIADHGSMLCPKGHLHAAVKTACGDLRPAPATTAPEPTDDKVCPQCKLLDDLRGRYGDRDETTPVEPLVIEPVAVPVG